MLPVYRNQSELTSEELQDVETHIIRSTQQNSFKKEYDTLTSTGAQLWGRRLGGVPFLSVPFLQCKDFFIFLSSVLRQRLEIYRRTTKISSTKICLMHYAICVQNVSLINEAVRASLIK